MNSSYRIIDIDDEKCIEFYGELDDSICPIYRDEISKYIENNRTNYIFNFKNVTFIDSSGIGFILGRYNQLKSHRKKLYIAGANDHIKKIFKISGIYTVINELEKVGEKR